jgi:hypothetical protein
MVSQSGGEQRFPSVVGASEIISGSISSSGDSSTRATVATPNSGKKARIIQIMAWTVSATVHRVEFYFDTGANSQTDRTKIIGSQVLDSDGTGGPNMILTFPDGAGPVGAADDVISVRTSANVATSSEFEVHYREE